MKEDEGRKRYYSFDGAINEEDTVEPERRRDEDMVPPSVLTDAVLLLFSWKMNYATFVLHISSFITNLEKKKRKISVYCYLAPPPRVD